MQLPPSLRDELLRNKLSGRIELSRGELAEFVRTGYRDVVAALEPLVERYYRYDSRRQLKPGSILEFATSSKYKDTDVAELRVSLEKLRETGIVDIETRGGLRYIVLGGETLDPRQWPEIYAYHDLSETLLASLGLLGLEDRVYSILCHGSRVELILDKEYKTSAHLEIGEPDVYVKLHDTVKTRLGEAVITVSIDTEPRADKILEAADTVLAVKSWASRVSLFEEILRNVNGEVPKKAKTAFMSLDVAGGGRVEAEVWVEYEGPGKRYSVGERLFLGVSMSAPPTIRLRKAEVEVRIALPDNPAYRHLFTDALRQAVCEEPGILECKVFRGETVVLKIVSRSTEVVRRIVRFEKIVDEAFQQVKRSPQNPVDMFAFTQDSRVRLLLALVAGLGSKAGLPHYEELAKRIKGTLSINRAAYSSVTAALGNPHKVIFELISTGRLTVRGEDVLFDGKPVEELVPFEPLVSFLKKNICFLHSLYRVRVKKISLSV